MFHLYLLVYVQRVKRSLFLSLTLDDNNSIAEAWCLHIAHWIWFCLNITRRFLVSEETYVKCSIFDFKFGRSTFLFIPFKSNYILIGTEILSNIKIDGSFLIKIRHGFLFYFNPLKELRSLWWWYFYCLCEIRDWGREGKSLLI